MVVLEANSMAAHGALDTSVWRLRVLIAETQSDSHRAGEHGLWSMSVDCVVYCVLHELVLQPACSSGGIDERPTKT